MVSREETKTTSTLHFYKFSFLPAIKEDWQYCVCSIYLFRKTSSLCEEQQNKTEFNFMEAVVNLHKGAFITGASVTHCSLKWCVLLKLFQALNPFSEYHSCSSSVGSVLNSSLVGSLLTILFPFVVHLDISKKYGRTDWLPDKVLMENFLKFIWLYIFSLKTLP